MKYLTKESLAGSSLPFLNKIKNNLLTFINVGSIRYSKLLLSGSVVTSDLHLFQKIVLLKACLIFSKNLLLSLIDKVTIGTKRLVIKIILFYQYTIPCPW